MGDENSTGDGRSHYPVDRNRGFREKPKRGGGKDGNGAGLVIWLTFPGSETAQSRVRVE
jgi:hypothetical protein